MQPNAGCDSITGNILHKFKRSDLMFLTTGYGNNMNAKIKTLS